MKKFLIVFSFILLISAAAVGQETRLSKAPKSFRTFFAAFKSSLVRSDKTAVANMTKFPFLWGLDAGDEGKYTRTQFIKNFRRLFGDDPQDAIAERDPAFSRGEDGSYVISTQDASHFSFVRSGRTYKFKAYVVEP